jgi:hypothetical protein
MVVDVAGEELCAQQLARGGLSTVVAGWATAKDKEAGANTRSLLSST